MISRLGALKYDINDAKVDVLDRANRNGSQLSQIYSSLGTFGVLAGILLLVNIFFMLADERKSELGMLRAVGLRRASLVGAFAAEGWCYALASAIAGTFAGLGLGRLMMAFAAKLQGQRTDELAAGAALRVHLGERAARNGDRLRHRDRHRLDRERVGRSLQHHPRDPRHHARRRLTDRTRVRSTPASRSPRWVCC